MTNFEEWRKAYYEVCPAHGPMVYCDDWTGPPEDIWFTYVVYPYGTIWEDNHE